MSIFHSRDRGRDRIVSALLDRELSDAEMERVSAAVEDNEDLRLCLERYRSVRRIVQSAAPPAPDPAEIEAAARRVREHVERTVRVRPMHPPWWRVSISVPVPVLSAAAAVILMVAVTATALIIRGDGTPASEPPGLAGLGASDRQINVQVNVDADHTERLLQWLNEQGHTQQITVQLPEQAQFQLRGDPVLIRREPADAGDLEIVPLEDEDE